MFTKYKLIDHMYKTIDPEMHSPLPRKDDWIIRGKKLYKVTCVWFYSGKSPVVQVCLFDFPAPKELREAVPRAKRAAKKVTA